jgi:hypothetical protein
VESNAGVVESNPDMEAGKVSRVLTKAATEVVYFTVLTRGAMP